MTKLLFLIILISLFGISCNNEEIVSSKKQENNYKTKAIKNLIDIDYKKGLDAYKLKKWENAIEYFDKVLKKDPENIKAQNHKKLAIIEKNNEISLKKGEDALSKSDYLVAILALKKIKDSSVYYTKAQEGIKKAQKQYKDFIFSKAKQAFNDKDYKSASKYLNALLKKYPDFNEAIKMSREINKELSKIE